MIKKKSLIFISFLILIVVILILFKDIGSNNLSYLECKVGSQKRILAFDKNYLHHRYVVNTGEFIQTKFAANYDEYKAEYKGVINEKGNEADYFLDRINGTLTIVNNGVESLPWACKKIKKPKIKKFKTKF